MRQQLKNAALGVAERSLVVPWLVNLAAFTGLAVSVLPDRYRDRPQEFRVIAGQINGDTKALTNDLELNFFVRAALEHRPTFIAELGAYALIRARNLARLFPGVPVYGLDITEDYANERVVDGVTIGPNSRDMIQKIASANPGHGLFCTRGTLCYYAEPDLRELFQQAAAHGIDFAISEPNTVGEESLKRSMPRTRATFYHPYLRMLRDAGYTLPDNDGRQIQCCVSEFGENRTFIFARAT